MTLILAYANTDFVVMAADRRITRNGQVVDDTKTKTLIFQNRLLFGFTEISEPGNNHIYTIDWLANYLSKSHDIFDSSELAVELTGIIN